MQKAERQAVIRDQAGSPLWVAVLTELQELMHSTQVKVLSADLDPQTRHDKAQRYDALRQYHNHITKMGKSSGDVA